MGGCPQGYRFADVGIKWLSVNLDFVRPCNERSSRAVALVKITDLRNFEAQDPGARLVSGRD